MISKFSDLIIETEFPDLTLETALEILEMGDFQQRWDQAKILPKFGEIIIQPLLNRLKDPLTETEEKWFIIKILGQFNQPEVIKVLIQILLETEDQELREITITSLSNIGQEAINFLTLLSDKSMLIESRESGVGSRRIFLIND